MRTSTLFCLALALIAGGCTPSHQRTFELKGQILSINGDAKRASIKHEDIKGFMSAMTMPYDVRDAKEFAERKPGDLITATLVLVDAGAVTEAYLKDVKKVGEAPLPVVEPMPTASSGFELLKLGQPVPDGKFIDQDGKPVTLASFRGSAVIVTFIYTSCPLPTFCPLMDRHFQTIQTRLQAEKNALRAHLLTVSFDPITDTPPVLKKHAEKLKVDPRLWTMVTGDRDEIDQWAMRFGVSVSRAMNDAKDITHNLRTVIVDRQGNLVQTYTGNEWTPEQILADVKVMVGVD